MTGAHATSCSTAIDIIVIIRNLKSRLLIWAGHVARVELSRNAYRVLVEGQRERTLGRPRPNSGYILQIITAEVMMERCQLTAKAVINNRPTIISNMERK